MIVAGFVVTTLLSLTSTSTSSPRRRMTCYGLSFSVVLPLLLEYVSLYRLVHLSKLAQLVFVQSFEET